MKAVVPYESFIMESQMTRNRKNEEIQIAGFASNLFSNLVTEERDWGEHSNLYFFILSFIKPFRNKRTIFTLFLTCY